ncbi:hypothetical protein TNCV_1310291 [Trichonephila clavipes]|nr:hypothetical protein TNCV_1310291 [Trichonephila clavipes]
MLTEAYGDKTLPRACVFEKYKWFSGERDNVEDDEHAGRPRQKPVGPSKNLVPELLPAVTAPNAEYMNAEEGYFEGDNATEN